MRRDLPVPELPDTELDPERAATWAETRGLSALAASPPRHGRRLRPMRPDSLLIRGLGDDDGEGLSPIVDRSTSFEHWSSKTSPYARAGSPTAEEAEALLGELE